MTKVLSLDPSGNYHEGKGTTGYAVRLEKSVRLGDIRAIEYSSREAYWFAHRELVEKHLPDVLVIESYRLFGHKSKQQIGSSLETPMLIGYLLGVAHELNIQVVIQDPSTKSRFSDDILLKLGIIEKRGNKYYFKGEVTNLHQRDALRHDLYYYKFGRKKV